MLRVDAKQGAPKDGHSPLELFQVTIFLFIYFNGNKLLFIWNIRSAFTTIMEHLHIAGGDLPAQNPFDRNNV